MSIKQLVAVVSLCALPSFGWACEEGAKAAVSAQKPGSASAAATKVSTAQKPAAQHTAAQKQSSPKPDAAASNEQAAPSATPQLAANTPVQTLQAYLSSTQSLNANFVQRVRGDDGELLQESRGTLAMARPNKLRWSTTEPYDYLVVTDGETLWRYDAGLEQLDSEPLSDDFTQTPALLLAGDTKALEEEFEVTRESNGFDEIFTLIPRNEDSPWRQLTLSYSHRKLVGMDMIDSLNQSTHIYLGSVVLNGPVIEQQFRMAPVKAAANT